MEPRNDPGRPCGNKTGMNVIRLGRPNKFLLNEGVNLRVLIHSDLFVGLDCCSQKMIELSQFQHGQLFRQQFKIANICPLQ